MLAAGHKRHKGLSPRHHTLRSEQRGRTWAGAPMNWNLRSAAARMARRERLYTPSTLQAWMETVLGRPLEEVSVPGRL